MDQVTWVLIGAGYTGDRLARALRERGDRVIATRRTLDALAPLAELGVHTARADLADPASLAELVPAGAIVVVLAPPGDDPAGEIRALLAAAPTAARIVYVSSTGVYGRANGGVVDEATPVAPLSPSGEARVAAEEAVAAGAISSVSLRVAGIWGPGRGLIERIRAGQYRIVGDGTAYVCRIHVDDLVATIIAAGDSRVTGAINVADDDPTPIGVVADTIAAHIGVASPARIPVAQVPVEVAAMLTADRQIANARLHELGVELRYPSWRSVLR